VVLTAKGALAWDIDTGAVLYEKAADERRPIASLNKLLSTLVVVDNLKLDDVIEVSSTAARAGRRGANIKLPIGHHATMQELLAASLIASANDAMIVLAEAVADSEANFVVRANAYATQHGLRNTVVSNATGLPGDAQYSTARDVREMLEMAYQDKRLTSYLSQAAGTLTTLEGARREYDSTNKLLTTYVPILAAKTGYTIEAGENLAIVTAGADGQRIGAIILGSTERFQDMKVLTEWLYRNYVWQLPDN